MTAIAIANQKGGCGKTTTAINLSAALAATGRAILLIDLDPQAHATFGLRANNQPTDKSMYSVLTEDPEKRRSPESCIVHVSPNFDIVPSNIQLSTLEQELKDKEDAVSELYRILSLFQSRYEYIIIDCPPSLGFLTFNALRAVGRVIIPIDMSAFTLMGVGKLIGMIELLQMKVGQAPSVHALATLFDRRTQYSQTILDEIRTFFRDRMLQSVIRLNVTLKRAVSAGVSIIDFDNTSNGAKDYLNLSREILRLEDVKHAPKTIGPSIPVQVLENQERPAPVQEEVGKPVDPGLKEVIFRFEAPEAMNIYVVGDFNEWKISDEGRLGHSGNRCWEKRMGIPPGRYRYKFIVDGEWTPDAKNPELEPNVFGSFDSIITI
jgi:chromosome partitioning protein